MNTGKGCIPIPFLRRCTSEPAQRYCPGKFLHARLLTCMIRLHSQIPSPPTSKIFLRGSTSRLLSCFALSSHFCLFSFPLVCLFAVVDRPPCAVVLAAAVHRYSGYFWLFLPRKSALSPETGFGAWHSAVEACLTVSFAFTVLVLRKKRLAALYGKVCHPCTLVWFCNWVIEGEGTGGLTRTTQLF